MQSEFTVVALCVLVV